MRTLLLLPLLLAPASHAQNAGADAPEESPLAVLAFKWSKARRTGEKIEPEYRIPERAVIQENKNFERNARVNDPVGVRDPNLDTLDGRSAALERSVQQARTPKPRVVDGVEYRARVRNAAAKAVEIIFWEYRLDAGATRRQFLCRADIKPGKEKELLAFSTLGPADAVSAGGPAGGPGGDASRETVVINRVEHADGYIWQRKGWSFAEIRDAYVRALATPWSPDEMCRRL